MMEQMSRIATVTDIRKIDDKRFCLFVDYEPFHRSMHRIYEDYILPVTVR